MSSEADPRPSQQSLRADTSAYVVLPPVLHGALEATEPHSDGRLCAHVPFESVEQAVAQFVQCGPDAEVVEPAELREGVLAQARATVRRYAD